MGSMISSLSAVRLVAGLLLAACPRPGAMAAEAVSFNRDIRPILSENCFHCHGQDAAKRKADLRLDTFEGATAVLDGGAALVPGQPEAGSLLRRLTSHDPDEQMPPPESNRKVSPAQTALVSQWIAEGGRYEKHWAFVPPVRAALPAPAAWDRQPWDAWVRTRLERENLQPTPEASPAAWLRRASFDLTGLAPGPAETDAFLAEVAARGESAYRRATEQLLASPRFGERLAADWLDAARYADTHGFNNDSMRSMWRWRDWVIEAFNRNLPYDQFITKQLAGDLLPGAVLDDRIATGFGRNHVINSEGGIIEEEYRVEYVADRVRTLGMTWLGLTLECSRCHDHKYDPVTAKDYYQLYAFFNQVPEWGEDGRVANAAPFLAAPTTAQQAGLAELTQKISEGEAARHVFPPGREPLLDPLGSLDRLVPPLPVTGGAIFDLGVVNGKPGNTANPDKPSGRDSGFTLHPGLGPVFQFPQPALWKLEADQLGMASNKPWTLTAEVRWQGGTGVLLSSMAYDTAQSSVSYGQGMEIRITAKGQLEVRVAQRWPAYAIQIRTAGTLLPGQWQQIAAVHQGEQGKAGSFQLYLNGRESAVEVLHDGLSGDLGAQALQVGIARGPEPEAFHGELARLRAWPRAMEPELIEDRADREWVDLAIRRGGLAESMEQLPRVQGLLRRWHPDTREAETALIRLNRARIALLRNLPTVMVMAELTEPRPTHVLLRGTYDAPGEAVSPGVPEALLGAWPQGAPKNRLGLAQWLTQPGHPLTARVVVNRFWQQIFGLGLVKTSEDFGFQSEYPPYPELLDGLALDFVESGWDVKAFFRSVVLSATYRQDSKVTPDMAARDPENRLFARGPRLRLPAEMIRDHALAVSGLLRERLGGPSVYPDQPKDLYKGIVVDAAYPGTQWPVSTGDDLYRRSLYTFWKRTVPHPVMNVFDTPDREFGCVRRSRTNTPLQALTLMNEPALLRAAGHLGQRILTEGGTGDAARLAWGFRVATGRVPNPREAAVLARLIMDLRKSYQSDPAGAAAMLQSGDVAATTPAEPAAAAEAAAWTAFASNLLNLDETITKN